MKKTILGLFFLCTAIDASNLDLPTTRTSPQKSSATREKVSTDDIIYMYRYFRVRYYPLIEGLRDGARITRDDILSAFSLDPFLERCHDGDHGSFKHRILPLKFGVLAHGDNDINVNERKAHHANLQVYVNVLKLFFQPIVNIGEAVAKLDTMEQTSWKKTYGAKLNEATAAFNEMTSADWKARIKAQETAFEEYSRN